MQEQTRLAFGNGKITRVTDPSVLKEFEEIKGNITNAVGVPLSSVRLFMVDSPNINAAAFGNTVLVSEAIACEDRLEMASHELAHRALDMKPGYDAQVAREAEKDIDRFKEIPAFKEYAARTPPAQIQEELNDARAYARQREREFDADELGAIGVGPNKMIAQQQRALAHFGSPPEDPTGIREFITNHPTLPARIEALQNNTHFEHVIEAPAPTPAPPAPQGEQPERPRKAKS